MALKDIFTFLATNASQGALVIAQTGIITAPLALSTSPFLDKNPVSDNALMTIVSQQQDEYVKSVAQIEASYSKDIKVRKKVSNVFKPLEIDEDSFIEKNDSIALYTDDNEAAPTNDKKIVAAWSTRFGLITSKYLQSADLIIPGEELDGRSPASKRRRRKRRSSVSQKLEKRVFSDSKGQKNNSENGSATETEAEKVANNSTPLKELIENSETNEENQNNLSTLASDAENYYATPPSEEGGSGSETESEFSGNSDNGPTCDNTKGVIFGIHLSDIDTVFKDDYQISSALLLHRKSLDSTVSNPSPNQSISLEYEDKYGSVPGTANVGLSFFVSFALEALPGSGKQVLFSGGTDTWVLAVDSTGKIHLDFNGGYLEGDTSFQSATQITAGEIVHLYAEHDGNHVRYYINGSLDGNSPVAGQALDQTALGSGNYPAVKFFPELGGSTKDAQGEIHSFTMFDENLSSADRNAVFCANKALIGGNIGSISCSSVICTQYL